MNVASAIERDVILNLALAHWGEDTQRAMAVGELGELLALFGREAQGRATDDAWIDEIADATIMLRQLALMHGAAKVDQRISLKLAALQAKIHNQRRAAQA